MTVVECGSGKKCKEALSDGAKPRSDDGSGVARKLTFGPQSAVSCDPMRISWKLVALSAAAGAAGAALVIFLLHLVVGIGNVGDAAFIGAVVGACLQVPRLRRRGGADSRESQEPQPRS